MRISDEYLEQQRTLHETRDDYGVASLAYAEQVAQWLARFQRDPFTYVTLLDYGCGKGRLARRLEQASLSYRLKITNYDPAVPTFEVRPEGKFDAVTCIDVLEHIEPGCLDAVLADIRDLTGGAAFLTIHCGPAVKTLPDGRNAHLIQRSPWWWLRKLMEYFQPTHFVVSPNTTSCLLIGTPVPKQE